MEHSCPLIGDAYSADRSFYTQCNADLLASDCISARRLFLRPYAMAPLDSRCSKWFPGMSVPGTFETCQPALKLSAFRDRPEARGQNDEFDPKQTQAVLKSLLSVNRPDRAAYTNMDRYKRPLQIVHLTQGRPIRLENIFGASAVFTRRSTGALRIGR